MVLSSAFLAFVAPAHAVVPGANDRLAWARVSLDGTQSHIVASHCEAPGCGAPALTTGDTWNDQPAWNPVRAQIAFRRTPVCQESFCSEIWLMNADGTNQQQLTTSGLTETASGSPSWAPDGEEMAFWTDRTGASEIWVMNADGSGQHPVTSGGCDLHPDWSPAGDKIAFQSCRDGNDEVYVMNADGSGQTRLTNNGVPDGTPAWSPDGRRIAFASIRAGNRDIYAIDPDGTDEARLTTSPGTDEEPAWSPDNSRIAFTSIRPADTGTDPEIYTMRPDGSDQNDFSGNNSVMDATPDWGPKVPRRHAWPVGATPVRTSLVPAYADCAAPNRTHGPPLGFPSCNPPARTSPHLTVGTPDANGAPAASVGPVTFRVLRGVPGAPNDSDVVLNIGVTDVRCAPGAQPCGSANAQGGPDYTGELDGQVTLRITDVLSGVSPSGGTEAATMTDYVVHLPLSCGATASTAIGATCSRISGMGAFGVPGIVTEGARAVWELGQVRFLDGGPDGVAGTAGNSLFLTEGIFIP